LPTVGRRGPRPGFLAGAPRPAVALPCRGNSLIRNSAPLGPYSRTVPRGLGWYEGGGLFL